MTGGTVQLRFLPRILHPPDQPAMLGDQRVGVLLTLLLPWFAQAHILGDDLVAIVGFGGSTVRAQVPGSAGSIEVLDGSPVVGQLRRRPVALYLIGDTVEKAHGTIRGQVLHAEVIVGTIGIP